MDSLAKQMDAKYFVFIQPTMGLLGVQSKLPKNKNSKDYKLLTELIKNQKYILELNNFYNSIRVYCKKLEFCFDISNEASPKGNFYTDPRHHNKDGNKIIAEKIYKIISKEF